MADNLQQLRGLDTELEQALFFHSRERTRSHRIPTKDLHRTHRFGVVETSVATATVFPDRTRLVTFATEIAITGASASGIICEFGDDDIGFKLGIDGTDLHVAAGNADDASSDGIDGSVAIASLGVVGARHHIAVGINPGEGKVRVWVDGLRVLRLQQDPITAFELGEWANSNAGAIGAAQAGAASTQRTSAIINGAPVDFALTLPFEVYMGQIPRQFS